MSKKKQKNDEFSLKEKYDLLIKARNFHYDNFNKWMSYFYVMIGAIFVAFCLILDKSKDTTKEYKTELVMISMAGFIVSMLWYWANKGYYYWNINLSHLSTIMKRIC